MWGIFWGICWKSILTWLVVLLTLFIGRILEKVVINDRHYEVFVIENLIRFWVIIGIIACFVAFLALITLIIISIWI